MYTHTNTWTDQITPSHDQSKHFMPIIPKFGKNMCCVMTAIIPQFKYENFGIHPTLSNVQGLEDS